MSKFKICIPFEEFLDPDAFEEALSGLADLGITPENTLDYGSLEVNLLSGFETLWQKYVTSYQLCEVEQKLLLSVQEENSRCRQICEMEDGCYDAQVIPTPFHYSEYGGIMCLVIESVFKKMFKDNKPISITDIYTDATIAQLLSDASHHLDFPLFLTLIKSIKVLDWSVVDCLEHRMFMQNNINQLRLDNIQLSKAITEKANTESQSLERRRYIAPKIRFTVFARDNFACKCCGATVKQGAILHIDHIVPFSKGGSHDMSNLQTLCSVCNLGKGVKTADFSD